MGSGLIVLKAKELWTSIWKKNRRIAIRISKLNTQFWQEQAREPLLAGVSRFILSRILKVAALDKVSLFVNLQLFILNFLTAPDAWHPCLSLFCSPLVASTPKTAKVSPCIFLFFLNPGKSQVWSSSSEKDLCSWFSPTPSSCWDKWLFCKGISFLHFFHLLSTFHPFSL